MNQETDETTKKNVYESQYIVALCNYLIVQGYKAEEITILTTYNGQIFQFAQVCGQEHYSNIDIMTWDLMKFGQFSLFRIVKSTRTFERCG